MSPDPTNHQNHSLVLDALDVKLRSQLTDEQLAELISAFEVVPAGPNLQLLGTIPDPKVGYAVINPMTGEGVSFKSTNIILNWRDVFEITPELLWAGASVTTGAQPPEPLIYVLATLHICARLRKVATVGLTETEAFVMAALWQNRDGDRMVDQIKGLHYVNELRAKWSNPELTSMQYDNALERLSALRCIMFMGEDVKVLESVRMVY